MVEPIAIKGLESIADESAMHTLISMLRDSSGETPMLARAALQRIEAQTTDALLKQEIDYALRDADKVKS